MAIFNSYVKLPEGKTTNQVAMGHGKYDTPRFVFGMKQAFNNESTMVGLKFPVHFW
jgi:hypothetical protein